MLSATQILEKIRTWESSGVDFKEVRIGIDRVTEPRREDLSDDFAAFANHSGGTIIFGVSDKTRQIIGIDPSKISILVRYISEICRDSISPPVVYFYVDSVQVLDEAGEGKYLVYVEIQRSLWLHKSKHGYFYRHGDSVREMSPEHLLRVGKVVRKRESFLLTSRLCLAPAKTHYMFTFINAFSEKMPRKARQKNSCSKDICWSKMTRVNYGPQLPVS